MYNKLVTDGAVDITVDEWEGMVDIMDESNFTVARIHLGTVESVELTVKEAATLQRDLHRFITRHGKRMSTAKARAAKARAK